MSPFSPNEGRLTLSPVQHHFYEIFWRMLRSQSPLVFLKVVNYSGHSFPFIPLVWLACRKEKWMTAVLAAGLVTALLSQQISETLLLCNTYAIERVK